jgi:hypothetical protein
VGFVPPSPRPSPKGEGGEEGGNGIPPCFAVGRVSIPGSPYGAAAMEGRATVSRSPEILWILSKAVGRVSIPGSRLM